jgi:hypothetical protein
MDTKKAKLPELSSEHKEALGLLGARPEFKALEKLFKVEENNIIIQSFKINSGDPAIAIKKSWQEGRLWELRKILKTFAEVRKGEDGS